MREAIFNSFKTIQEMYEARNRMDIVDHLKRISDVELEDMAKAKHVFKIDVPELLRIVYYMEPKLKVADVKALMGSEFENHLIVIKEKTTSSNIAQLQVIDNTQVFEIKELQFNISKHILVPKHRLIEASSDEINAIFQKLNIKSRSQLPVILKTDPMARFLDAKTGDVVEITRYSPTSGEHIFYRITV